MQGVEGGAMKAVSSSRDDSNRRLHTRSRSPADSIRPGFSRQIARTRRMLI